MSSPRIWLVFGLSALIGVVAIAAPSGSSSSSSSSRSTASSQPARNQAAQLYDQGVAAAKAGNYGTAVRLLTRANNIKRNDPDILNMLAYSQRKSGRLDEALANYDKALKLRSFFPEAREYRGEAYIQAALREIETLRKYGNRGKEQHAELVAAFKQAAASLEGGTPTAQPASRNKKW